MPMPSNLVLPYCKRKGPCCLRKASGPLLLKPAKAGYRYSFALHCLGRLNWGGKPPVLAHWLRIAPDFDVNGIEPDIQRVDFQRPGEEGVHGLVDLTAQPGYLAFADAFHPLGIYQVIDGTGGNALNNKGFLVTAVRAFSAIRRGSRKARK